MFAGKITGARGDLPAGESPRLRRARRGRAAGPADDAAHAHVRAEVRRRRRAHRSPASTGCRPTSTCPARRTRVLAQLDQSDLAFLRDRVRAVGGELWVADGALHARRATVAGRRRRRRRAAPQPASCASCACAPTSRTRPPRSSSAAGTWRPARRSPSAPDDSVLGAESSGGDTGAAVAAAARSATASQTVAAAVPATTAEARDRAAAVFRARARRFVRGEAVCDARRRRRASGARSRWRASAPRSAATTRSSRSVHRFDARDGARSEIVVERAVLKSSAVSGSLDRTSSCARPRAPATAAGTACTARS